MTDEQHSLYPDKSQSDDKAIKKVGYVIFVVMLFVAGVITGRSVKGLDAFNVSNVLNDSKLEIKGDAKGDSAPASIDFDLYWRVWDATSARYVDEEKTDESKMFYDSIKGMVSAYGDPHTIFLDPTETSDFNNSNSGNFFSGIGAELGYADNWPIIVSPLKGSPALEAGIRPGDKILAVDGVDVKVDDSIFELATIIRGEKGTDVVLTVLHKGDTQPVDVTITRDSITVPSMEVTMDGDTAVLEVSRFTEASVAEWRSKWDSAVDEVVAQGAKGLVLDLRGNPGGYMDAASYAASEFLSKGEIVLQQEDRNGHVREDKVVREGKLQEIPVVILINGGSASASEILAGALQKNDRATVVGEESFGKGTAQDVVEFDDGSSLHVTVLKWLLPDGTWINEDNKIVPDNVVELTDEDFKEGLDPQMDKALELLK